MKSCKTCIHWEAMTRMCNNKRLNKFVQAWHPQALPDWVNVKIYSQFCPGPEFRCILWEKRK